MDALLFGVFVALMIVGAPVAVAMGLAGALAVAVAGLGIMSVPTNVYSGLAKYPLMAVPMFVIAGLVFERAGVAARIVRFASACVGERRGSLAVVAVLVAMILGGISGSGPADSAAVAAVMLPSMLKAGYPREFSATLIAAAGSTAILIPPSIAYVLYSILVPGASIPALFSAGLFPGIIAGLALIGAAAAISHRHGFEAHTSDARPPFWQSLREAFWGLLAPVVILGGIRSGVFTPTEAAAVAVAYGVIVGLLIYRSLDVRGLIRVFADAAEISAVILLVVALAGIFAWASSTLGSFDRLSRLLITSGASEIVMLAGIQVLLLIAGMFLDAISIFFIFLPLLIPVAQHFHWDLVWFGVVITMNMALGQVTPPIGVNLMVTCKMAGVGMDRTLRWVGLLVIAMIGALLLVTYVPEIALWLPRRLGYVS